MGTFGGTAPMIITYLMGIFPNQTAIPIYYLMISASVSLIGLAFITKTKKQTIS